MTFDGYADWTIDKPMTFDEEADWTLVPEGLHGGLRGYVMLHIEPGGFMSAVLRNDLLGAVQNGDTESRAYLSRIVQFLYWSIPSSAWGTPEAVEQWLAVDMGDTCLAKEA